MSEIKTPTDIFLDNNVDFAQYYSRLQIVHVTSSANIDSIRENGLVTNPGLIRPEIRDFLLAIYKEHGKVDPNVARRIQTHILGRRDTGADDESRGTSLTLLGSNVSNRSGYHLNYKM